MQRGHLLGAVLLAGACGLTAAGGVGLAAGGAPKPPRGYTVVTSTVIGATPNGRTHGEVACPSGLVPLGGGVAIQSTNTHANVNSSFPLAQGWAVEVTNATSSDFSFAVVA